MAIYRSQEPPVARPGIDLDLDKASADCLHSPQAFAAAAASPRLAYRTLVGRSECDKGDPLLRIFLRRDDPIANLEFVHVQLQYLGSTIKKVISQFIRGAANRSSLLGDGPAGEPLAAQGCKVRIAPDDVDLI